MSWTPSPCSSTSFYQLPKELVFDKVLCQERVLEKNMDGVVVLNLQGFLLLDASLVYSINFLFRFRNPRIRMQVIIKLSQHSYRQVFLHSSLVGKSEETSSLFITILFRTQIKNEIKSF